MHEAVSILSGGLAVLVSLPVLIVVLEIFAAFARRARGDHSLADLSSTRITVLVPAHNETEVIAATLANIKAQLRTQDRLVVVADNCTDDTASIARRSGAEVIERNDPARRGKGYALAFGRDYLMQDPPDILIVVDADCRLQDGAVGELAKCSLTTGRPAQALNLMTAEDGAVSQKVAAFAWRIKNQARPLGLARLGLPCQLMGTGMAFPWRVISSLDLATGNIVEDLKIGLDLAALGSPPVFCPSAIVTSKFPASAKSALAQRQRWEHGHLAMIFRTARALLLKAVQKQDSRLLALTLDLMVPPLGLVLFALVLGLLISGFAMLFGAAIAAFAILLTALIVFSISLALAWMRFGREIVSIRELINIPGYLFGKFNIYKRLLKGKSSDWVRTDRGGRDDAP